MKSIKVNMTETTKKRIKLLFTIAIVVVIIILVYNFFIEYLTMEGIDVNKAELLETIASPSGTYELSSFFINGGSLSGDAVLVQIKSKDVIKKIYFNYPKRTVTMIWLDENTVKLDDIVLDVRKDKYDWRYGVYQW